MVASVEFGTEEQHDLINSLNSDFVQEQTMRYTGVKRRPVRRMIVVFCRKVAKKVVKSSYIK